MHNFLSFVNEGLDESVKDFDAEFIISPLLEGQPNPAFANDKQIAYFEYAVNNPKTKDSKLKQLLVDLIDKYKPLMEKVKKKFEGMMKKELRKFNRAKFMSDMKQPPSIIDKAIKRKKGFEGLNDLVRGAVLLETKSDCDKFVKKFIRRNKSMVIGYEEKERGEDKTYGYYGSHHIDLNIDGIIVELQIMSKKLWTYKKAAHDIYKKNRSKPGGPDDFDMNLSKRIFSMGNNSESIDGDETVMPEFTYEEMHEMQFENWVEVDLNED